MTQENKELLLKDLCARLPYKVIVSYAYNAFNVRNGRYVKRESKYILDCDLLDVFISPRLNEKEEYIKPYLFPLSSMTEEQKEEYCSLQQKVIYNNKGLVNSDVMEYVNWCYKNHIDINNLIPKGLAIDATGLNIY